MTDGEQIRSGDEAKKRDPITSKKEVMRTLMLVWTHLGSARDNDEPVDCDEMQDLLHDVGNFLEELWEVDYEGDSTKYGAPVKEPRVDVFDMFVVDEEGETEYQRSQKAKESKIKPQ